jgi:sulfur-oxidizing protein SoxZ
MGDPMKIRAKANGDEVEVKVLMAHEMETGQRKASDGSLVPAWFIQNVTAKCNDKVVLQANWGPAVSKNPFMSFAFKGGKAGDTVEITWTDNKGDSRTDKTKVA